jgi:hypothetical protein
MKSWKSLEGKMKPAELKELRELIDRGGELQRACLEAKNAYNDHRAVLEDRLRTLVGERQTVQAKHYEARISYDEQRWIDPNEFIKKVKDKMIRTLCLKVVLKSADTVLGSLNPSLLYKLTAKREREVPTLHIERRS